MTNPEDHGLTPRPETPSSPPTAPSTPPARTALEGLIADRQDTTYVDGQYGSEQRVVTATWRPPREVSAEVAALARRDMHELDDRLRPLRDDLAALPEEDRRSRGDQARERVAQWLAAVGCLVKLRRDCTMADFQHQLDLWPRLLAAEFPLGVFTDKALHRFGAAHKFWPAYQELADFLAAEVDTLRARRRRCADLVAIHEGRYRWPRHMERDAPETEAPGTKLRDMPREKRDEFFTAMGPEIAKILQGAGR